MRYGRSFLRKGGRITSLKILIFIILLFFLTASLAPVLAPNPPDRTELSLSLQGPSLQFPLGTDHLGRCVLSRLLWGASASLFSSIGIIGIVFCLGTFLGVISGYFGGGLDSVISNIVTIVQAFPRLILAIAIAGVLGVGIVNTIIALSLVNWTEYARLARSMVLGIKERTYIKAARICGESHLGIILRHVLPNIFPSLIVSASLDISVMIMEVAALSYLGLGVKSSTPEWGAMMNLGQAYLQTDPRLVLLPGAALFLTAAVFNLFGDKLRDKLDI